MGTTTSRAKRKGATGDQKAADAARDEEVVVSFKGFDQNFRCRGYQYEVGKTYTHDGPVEPCESGFHACEYPLNVFDYYPPAGSRFAVVRQSGELKREGGDTKIASAKITIDAELKLPEIIAAAVKWVFDRSTPEGETATGDQGAASATGDRGAASATGYQGAASATGHRGAALASGWSGSVCGAEGNALFLVERDDNYNIVAVWAGIAGRDGIEPDAFYTLKNGKPVKQGA